ncbi:helix-turn-helix transcriptional regulator [uncultured Roseovarius sp.]|uniref:helix-turn-helix transcriptional regulator n=1 Tax=uncultured Roseovarius sp. TaxID=293344 RepID=UPI00261DCB69|nr:helix-turn-helix transcriptional regulator [uncultured Roseovarius sp.]
MSTEFALDLRAARRKAGYTQGDIAHLLDHHQSHVSDLEKGRVQPSLNQIVTLSLIYGRSFESFFAVVMVECQSHLTTRLSNLPPSGATAAGTFNRDSSLKKLERRLANSQQHHGST